MPKVVTNMLDAKAELDGRLRTIINEFVDAFAVRMTSALQPAKPAKDATTVTSMVRKTIEKDVPFLRKKLAEYIPDARTKETLVAAVMEKVVDRYEDWYEEVNKDEGARGGGGGGGGRKGKGREDEVWGPGAFGEWCAGVFDVGRLGFLEEDEGLSRRGSSRCPRKTSMSRRVLRLTLATRARNTSA